MKSRSFYTTNDFRLKNLLFGALTLTDNPNPDKYSYFGYI